MGAEVYVMLTTCGCRFRHHYIAHDLPLVRGIGDYGQTALFDVDGDGRLDFVCGRKGPGEESVLYWFENRGAEEWVRHLIGHDTRSDVGAAALDVDGDGRSDVVCSGVWFRNPERPREQAFERYVFDPQAGGAHDILVCDVDGDGRDEILMMGDPTTELNGIWWYKIPEDPYGPWEGNYVGPPIHGALCPAGVGDLDGDGDLDIARGDTWFENVDGQGREWRAHPNLPFGQVGEFGMAVRTVVVDLDGDGRQELVMCDCDVVGSRVAILHNLDGRGGAWSRQDLPQSRVYGSLHSLAVADFTGNGRLDILVAEQEELLPPGREDPVLTIYENTGEGEFVERIVADLGLGWHELQVGDVDGDGDVDIVSKVWSPAPWNANGGRMHVDWLENLAR